MKTFDAEIDFKVTYDTGRDTKVCSAIFNAVSWKSARLMFNAWAASHPLPDDARYRLISIWQVKTYPPRRKFGT